MESIEHGRVVIYLSSLQVIRRTSERCKRALALLHNFGVKVDQRDLAYNKAYIHELYERLGTDRFDMPQIFLNGKYFGTLEHLEKWVEHGKMRSLLDKITSVCRYLLFYLMLALAWTNFSESPIGVLQILFRFWTNSLHAMQRKKAIHFCPASSPRAKSSSDAFALY